MTVLIVGGGISGLTLALTCHQVGIPFKVFEAAPKMQPLGVGINLQPAAIRELYELGFESDLDQIGVKTRDFGLYTKKGLPIWTEPRGLALGYHWPQYSVHRGKLTMMLHDALITRAGPSAIETRHRAIGYSNSADRAAVDFIGLNGLKATVDGDVVIAADGIHSAIRAQMVPDEGPPCWTGVQLFRATTYAKPFLSGASMVIIGHEGRRFVSYPISGPDPDTGLAQINWIGCLACDPKANPGKSSYSRAAALEDVLPAFEDFGFDWLDVPTLMKGAKQIFEYPMIDRDPIDTWVDGRVVLIGDAAHPAYPVSSNGAGAGIIDARVLVSKFLDHGLSPKALHAFQDERHEPTATMVMNNRKGGPDAILDIIEERCGGQFDHLQDVISKAELQDHADAFKRLAGYGVEETNTERALIAKAARFSVN